jgi:hypothetical protein
VPWRRRFLEPMHGRGEAHNRRILRFESVAIGLVNSAYQFVAVLIARLGGTPFELALLNVMPYLGTLFLAIPIGTYLHGRGRIVPWYARSRLLANLAYAGTALAILAPPDLAIPLILVIWGAYSIPAAVTSVTLPIIMDGIAGPRGRYALMGLRWAVQVLVTSVGLLLVGQILSRMAFPLGYQVVLVAATLIGVVGAWVAEQFWIPPAEPTTPPARERPTRDFRELATAFWAARDFRWFVLCELIYLGGTRLAVPLVPLVFVNELGASDAVIGLIATVQAVAQMSGYVLWPRVSRRWGEGFVLLVVPAAAGLYPGLLSLADGVPFVIVIAGFAAFFTAGVDLVVFDEMMRTVPPNDGTAFVAIHVTVGNVATVAGPLVGAAVAAQAGINVALQVATLVCLIGSALLVVHARRMHSTILPAGAG